MPPASPVVCSPDAVKDEVSLESAGTPDMAATAPAPTLRKSRRLAFIVAPPSPLFSRKHDQVAGSLPTRCNIQIIRSGIESKNGLASRLRPRSVEPWQAAHPRIHIDAGLRCFPCVHRSST